MKLASYRPYVLLVALTLGGCLENVTVGRETQPLSPADSGISPIDGSIPSTDSGPVNEMDAGRVDGGGVVVDAGPCVPEDCNLQDVPPLEKASETDCPTNETKVCRRNQEGVCAELCPEIPDDQQCASPVQIAAADGGLCGGGGLFCRYEIGLCGGGVTGACAPVPTDCGTAEDDPVCGCDGVSYPNPCSAFQAGVSVLNRGECVVKVAP